MQGYIKCRAYTLKYCWSCCWKSLVQTDTTFKMLNSETPCCTEHIYVSSTWYTGLILAFWTSNEGFTRFILHFSTQLSISEDLWLMQNRLLYRKLPRRSPIVKRNEILLNIHQASNGRFPKKSLTHHDRKNKCLMNLCFQKGT